MSDQASTIVVEDLKIRNMTASARGTIAQPRTHVARKPGLKRSVLSTGWGDLRRMLDDKAVNVTAVNPAYTSQTCSECGHVNVKSRPCQSRFECVSRGHAANADVNAAHNILASRTGATARGKAMPTGTLTIREMDSGVTV